jgi:hypothetical protein
MFRPSREALPVLVLSLSLTIAACTGGAPPEPAGEVQQLTGAHTRVVWVQGDGTDPFAFSDNLLLMGLDSRDSEERVILGERTSYVKPMITPRGDRIIYSTRPVPGGAEVFIVNWDGSGRRLLARGFALALWKHPDDGSEWMYLGTDNSERAPWEFATISRMPIDQPEAREVVWNQGVVSGDTFQVSADGRLGGGLFPWPTAGVVDLPNGEVRPLGEGCWTALATADVPLFWYFDGAHRNLIMVNTDTTARWTVNINDAPGFENAEVYHPRWTNHPRFLAISGPYNQGGPNQVRSGGAQSEVYLGRFSEDYTRVEAWARVTNNDGGDSYPDVWIAEDSPHARRAEAAPGPSGRPAVAGGAEAAARQGRVVVDVRLIKSGPVPTPAAIAPYRNALVVGEYEVVAVVEGEYADKTVLVAHWAIRDAKTLPTAVRSAGSTHRLTLEPYDAHPELEGDRLSMASDAPNLPIYYDVGS